MQRAIIFYIRGSRIEINHITFFSAGVSWRLENPNMLQGPGFSCRKPLMQFQETNPPLYHPVTAWLTLRSLHCVCDSYNRTHVLIKDGHEATSACHSSIPRCKNCFQSPSLNKPKNRGLRAWCNTVNISVYPPLLSYLRSVSRPRRGLWGYYTNWCTCKSCQKKKKTGSHNWILKFILQGGLNHDIKPVSAASAAAVFCFFFSLKGQMNDTYMTGVFANDGHRRSQIPICGNGKWRKSR